MKVVKKRRINKIIPVVLLLVVAIILKITLSVTLETYKNNIIRDIQDAEWRISELEKENVKLRIDIQSLQNKDAIYEYMLEEGYTQNMDNIVYIGD